jgi:hypothetical protein
LGESSCIGVGTFSDFLFICVIGSAVDGIQARKSRGVENE